MSATAGFAFGPAMTDLLATALMGGAYLLLFAIAEALRWIARVPPAVTRVVAHVAGGLLALLLPLLFHSPTPVLALAAAFLALLAIAERRGFLNAIHNAPDRRAGVYLFPVALALVYLLAAHDWPTYATAVLTLACGDAAAGTIGRRFGRHHFAVPAGGGQHKSLEGSAAAFVVVFITTLLCLSAGSHAYLTIISAALCVALVSTLVEALSPWGTDNLSMPLAALATVQTLRSLGLPT